MKRCTDEDLQEDIIAYEMQVLFDDYKSGDREAYGRILAMQARYGALLGKSGKRRVRDLLRKETRFQKYSTKK